LADAAGMLKRVLAGLLWFYVTWYAWSVLAFATGLPDQLGVVVGATLGILVAADPARRIWSARQPRNKTITAPKLEPDAA
jgi:hypothetical protein